MKTLLLIATLSLVSGCASIGEGTIADFDRRWAEFDARNPTECTQQMVSQLHSETICRFQ